MIHLLHRWVLVESKEQPSAYEQVTANGVSIGKAWGKDFFERSVICTYKCSVCRANKVERV